jgi:hypothetical protein
MSFVTTVARADYERLGSWTLDLPRTAFAEPSNFELQPANVPANDPFSLRSDQRMVLVANERAIPLAAEDGEIVARLPAGQDGATHAIRTPLNLSRIGVRAFLDPTVAPGSLPPIRLRHPETGLARV